MTASPPYATDHELPHLGALLKRMRQVRGLSQTDIALALGVTSSSISKFEGTGRSRRNQIVERYIRLLQETSVNGSRVPYPLEGAEAALLQRMEMTARRGHRRGEREPSDDDLAAQLTAYDFALPASANCPAALKDMLQRLRRAALPAFLIDGLWFIHAMNGAMLNLFDINPEAAYLQRWECWHLLATELVEHSPVRRTHVYPNHATPHSIWAFFHATAPYLFTPQMRTLLRNLHQLSRANRMHFSEWWYSATAFALYFDPARSARLLRQSGHDVCAAQVALEPQPVPVTANMNVPYFLGVWQPMGKGTQTAFESLRGPAGQGDVFLAAEYDAGRTFHVNCWAEVAQEVTPK